MQEQFSAIPMFAKTGLDGSIRPLWVAEVQVLHRHMEVTY
jgi:hypothetical protein